MLEENHPFRDCWIQTQVEQVQFELLQLLSPILEASKMEIFGKDIRTSLNRAFTDAFQFRARCVPPRGTRYELMQVKPGDIFDPEYMEAQRSDGSVFPIPRGKARCVKVCVHGCLISHVIEDEALEGDSYSTVSQPFVSAHEKENLFQSEKRVILKSGKAIVILEDESQS
jgi:hypothetical protein